MVNSPTPGEKRAKTIKNKDPKFYEKIGAKGGEKTEGTFKTKRGLAKAAGIKSGKVRKLKAIGKEIVALSTAISHLPEGESDNEQHLLAQRHTEYQQLEVELAGGHAITTDDGTVMEYLQ